MTIETYKEKVKELQTEFDQKKMALAKEFAFSNNRYKVGDMITDHLKTIKIESISVYNWYSTPECKYKGVQYNKDGKISKKQDNTIIYQSNIIAD